MDKTASLSPELLAIIQDKGTERPYSGRYDNFTKPGTYLCKRCGLALFRAAHKFHSGCGWPSFEEEVSGSVAYQPDKDGMRTEILCKRCSAHLGHVFYGEGFTGKNTRHCVNSASLEYVPSETVLDTEEAIVAAGCFWGVEYYFQRLPGVLKTEVGYTGGSKTYPSYEDVCRGNTGHYEALRVLYDTQQVSYEKIIKFFFEIHDATQGNGQGPDIGQQYQSVIFYFNEDQENTAKKVMQLLEHKGIHVATKLLPVRIFWPAEDYHQAYYDKQRKEPYCHRYTKIFD